MLIYILYVLLQDVVYSLGILEMVIEGLELLWLCILNIGGFNLLSDTRNNTWAALNELGKPSFT